MMSVIFTLRSAGLDEQDSFMKAHKCHKTSPVPKQEQKQLTCDQCICSGL